jgi:hypothetical protein
MMLRRLSTLWAVAALVPLLGCQVLVASVTSPSDWVSGTGESISGSLGGLSRSSGSGGGDAAKLAYRRDVRAYAAHFAATGGSSGDFLRGIGAVAAEHGVTHWESQADTHRAIGEGLRDAGVEPAAFDRLTARATEADPAVLALVREGYASPR